MCEYTELSSGVIGYNSALLTRAQRDQPGWLFGQKCFDKAWANKAEAHLYCNLVNFVLSWMWVTARHLQSQGSCVRFLLGPPIQKMYVAVDKSVCKMAFIIVIIILLLLLNQIVYYEHFEFHPEGGSNM